MNETAIYNTIGKTYDTTRRPDPAIVHTLLQLLNPSPHGRYLDIACGSGNYTSALAEAGLQIEGIDISEEMLSKARAKNPAISWHSGDAKMLPFQDLSFDGALCTLATHHIQDIETAFQEAYRVVNKGKFVILTCTPEQIQDCWLWEYFPKMLEDGKRSFANFERIEHAFQQAGFRHIQHVPFFVTNDLTDHFLYTGKYRPEIYLDPTIRAGISSFHISVYGDEVEKGLAQLQEDITSGRIQEIMGSYESKQGDYLFVAGEKEE